MNPDIQKVIDFIREGAQAAAGPAKWGFEQVCAYRASAAMADLVVSCVGFVMVATSALLVVRYTIKNWDGFISEKDQEVLWGSVSVILSIFTVVFMLFAMFSITQDVPIINNPAGSVLSDLAKR